MVYDFLNIFLFIIDFQMKNRNKIIHLSLGIDGFVMPFSSSIGWIIARINDIQTHFDCISESETGYVLLRLKKSFILNQIGNDFVIIGSYTNTCSHRNTSDTSNACRICTFVIEFKFTNKITRKITSDNLLVDFSIE